MITVGVKKFVDLSSKRFMPAASNFLRNVHLEKSYRPAKCFKDEDLFLDDMPARDDEPKWKFNKTDKPVTKKSKKGEKRPVRSFKHRCEAYMLPFTLDVFISKKYIHASIMHRMSNKVVAVASTNSKDLRSVLKSRCDINACRALGQVLAERAMEADVFTALYYTRKNEKLEGKLLAVVDSVKENGINLIISSPKRGDATKFGSLSAEFHGRVCYASTLSPSALQCQFHQQIKVITIDQDPILAHPLHHGHDAVPSSSTVDIFNTNAVPSSSTADIFDTTTNESHAQIPVQRDTSLHNTSTEEIHPSPAEQKEVIDHHESPSLESLKSSQYHSLSPESMLSSAGSSQYGSPSREWALAHSKEDSSS